MIEVYLAGNNVHKYQEFETQFDAKIIKILKAPKALTVEESGETYMQNAYLKAHAYYREFKLPVMADDSGLEVSVLPGLLGVKSARFGGENLSSEDKCRLLLEKMEGMDNRSAAFHCYLCFYLSDDQVFFFEGRLNGTIALELSGQGGFGYDPLFIPEGKQGSLATHATWKKTHSHRAIACQFAEKFFTQRNCHNL